MTVKITNQKELFDQLVKNGYKLIKLDTDLTPSVTGWTNPDFVYETEYKENQNYGIVGGSIHKDKEGKTGELIFIDFDIKEKIEKNGKTITKIIPEAKAKLQDVSKIVNDRDYYLANTKSGALHIGILKTENIPQRVSLYQHQDCEKLRIDTRTDGGYVVAIAQKYQITKIPELFDRVITDFESFMYSLSFESSNNETGDSSQSGSLSIKYKQKARKVLDTGNASDFSELGTEKVSTHDIISFWVMSCRSRSIPLEVTIEKIMGVLRQITTSKDNEATEKEIEKIYNKDYNDFKIKKDENNSKTFNNKQWNIVAHKIQENDSFVTVRETKEMWMYDEEQGVYIPNADTYVEEKAQSLIFNCNTKSRNEIKNSIKANQTMILSSDFFDSNIINTESGVIDPNTFEVLPHSSDYLTTTKLPFKVNMKANNFKLWKHITHNIIEEKDSKLFLEILWVLISWKNPHKKCIIFKGLSDTQKTTLMEIISWIIGSKNIAVVKPQKFLVSGDRFTMSRFIGKRANFSEEINNLTPDMLENLKASIGGMVQDTESKNSNEGREFDPKRFLFIFSTNFLDSIYQRIDDNSMINRFQFMKFNHVIKKKKGDWSKDFFINEEDKISAIETIIRLMLSWKKGGKEIQWDEAWQTKEILRTEQPIEDKYFESGRIIRKRLGKMMFDEVKIDFEKYCETHIENQAFGYLMKEKGFESKHSGLKTYYQGYSLAEASKNEKLS